MAREIKTGLRIDMNGNILAQSKRYTDAINRFSQSGRRDMKALGESTGKVRRNFDGMGNRLAGLAAGAGAVAMVKQVGEMERRMTRLGIASDQSDASIKQLKDDIYATATAPDIRVDPSQIITAIEQILEMTGDMEFSKAQIRNIGIALQATGADAQAVGGLFAEFEKAGIKSPEAVAQAIGTLAKQGKEGAFTLAEFARMGPRLFSAYAAVGRVGPMATKEIGAVAQVVRGATGDSAQATESIEALIRVFSDANKIKGLNKAGIKVFDAAELKKGHQVLRPINELMADIVRKTKGRATLIQDLLGDEQSTRAFGNMINEFKQTGDVKSLERFMQMTDNGTMALKDSQRAANDSAAAMTELYAVLQKFADDRLTQPIHYIADALKELMANIDPALEKVFGAIDAGAKVYDTVSTGLTSGSMKRPEEAPKKKKPSGVKPGTGGYVPYVPPEAAAKAPTTGSVPPQYNDLGRDRPAPAKPGAGLVPPEYNDLGRDKPAPAQAPAKPIDVNLSLDIQGAPVKVAAMKNSGGEINVKNTRAGAHFQ